MSIFCCNFQTQGVYYDPDLQPQEPGITTLTLMGCARDRPGPDRCCRPCAASEIASCHRARPRIAARKAAVDELAVAFLRCIATRLRLKKLLVVDVFEETSAALSCATSTSVALMTIELSDKSLELEL